MPVSDKLEQGQINLVKGDIAGPSFFEGKGRL